MTEDKQDDLVSRNAVFRAISDAGLSARCVYGRSEEGMAVFKELIRLIKAIPAEEVEKKKSGHWIFRYNKIYEGGGYYECSRCGARYAIGFYAWDEMKYCELCGAEMVPEAKTEENNKCNTKNTP